MAAPEAPAIRADSLPSKPEIDEGMILRKLPGFLGKSVSLLAIGTTIYHIYVGAYGAPEPYFFRVLHLTLMLTLGFLLFPKSGKGPINKVPLFDWVIIAVWLAATSYIFSNLDYISNRMFFITPLTTVQRFFAIATIIIVLEVTRRTVGMALTGVVLVIIVYSFAGPYLPGVFFHTGRKMDYLLDLQYLNPDGVFGLITGIAATFVMMFIIFGAFLNHSGFGAFVIDIATALAGWSRGGPAKVAVFASGLIGMIQGVSTANVVTTGVFTIPMMKRIGFRPAFAGGVEAAASTGGNVMPPVMAAAAFVMAEVTGIPYITIIKHAFIPATLYFLSIGIMVHLYSVQHGIKATPREECPQLWKVLNERGYLLIPIIVLVWLLFIGKSPMLSAIASIGAVIVMSNLRWYGIPVIALDWLFIGEYLDWILIWTRMDWLLTWASRSTLAAIASAGLVVALSLHQKNIRTMLGQIIKALEEGARKHGHRIDGLRRLGHHFLRNSTYRLRESICQPGRVYVGRQSPFSSRARRIVQPHHRHGNSDDRCLHPSNWDHHSLPLRCRYPRCTGASFRNFLLLDLSHHAPHGRHLLRGGHHRRGGYDENLF